MRNNAGGRLGVGMLEDDAVRGQMIEVRRKRTLGTEEAHTVGTSGAYGDQHQVGFGYGSGESETYTNEHQTYAGNELSHYDSKCRGCAAIDQNLKTSRPTSLDVH